MEVVATSKVVRIRGDNTCKIIYQKTSNLTKWKPEKIYIIFEIIPYFYSRFPERMGQWFIYLS